MMPLVPGRRNQSGGTLLAVTTHDDDCPALRLEGMAAMDRQYDLVIVGTGVTSAVASRCREAGWTVAVIDSRPFGGTCALRGCLPKKILVGAAEAVHHARDMATIGVPAATLTIDWPALMRFKRSMIDPTPQRTEQAWA